ncbi:hypothetical protein GCM10022408_14390 [Hymenobacter fastidiosus]|uniref:DUF4974 domain-containing protein n=1 Tax=Hymenobacter fastidiosus TaxID=486264 RepID=A0ABP7RY50_9BACT
MKYAAYSTEDFLADESFQDFVLSANPAAGEFWQDWVSQNPAREAEFQEAVAILQILITQPRPVAGTLKREEVARLWQSMRPLQEPRAALALRTRRMRRLTMTTLVALVLLVLAVVGVNRRPQPAPEWTSYVTHGDEYQQVQLPDGSVVILNANSTLRLAAAWQPGQPREVWLTGGGYFNVRHTAPARLLTAVAAAPANVKFVVHTGPLDVAVLGTQFTVLNNAGKTKVVLNTGQIQLRLRQPGSRDQLLMKPGELVEYSPATPRALLVKRTVKADFYSAWTKGQLDFNDTPVSEIIALLEDTHGLHITLRDPKLRQQKLTGSVPTHDLDELLTALSKSLEVKVHRQGNQVWLD